MPAVCLRAVALLVAVGASVALEVGGLLVWDPVPPPGKAVV